MYNVHTDSERFAITYYLVLGYNIQKLKNFEIQSYTDLYFTYVLVTKPPIKTSNIILEFVYH